MQCLGQLWYYTLCNNIEHDWIMHWNSVSIKCKTCNCVLVNNIQYNYSKVIIPVIWNYSYHLTLHKKYKYDERASERPTLFVMFRYVKSYRSPRERFTAWVGAE